MKKNSIEAKLISTVLVFAMIIPQCNVAFANEDISQNDQIALIYEESDSSGISEGEVDKILSDFRVSQTQKNNAAAEIIAKGR